MFTTIEEVDDHVKRLLSISKNIDDIDVQCYTIAKLYFDIEKFDIAKSYIERYLKAKSNSESGYILKAKVHEQLHEWDLSLQCYETLHTVYKRPNYAVKACECLLKIDNGDKKAKNWIKTLEADYPNSEFIGKLKSRFINSMDASLEEMEKLAIKMKNDKNNQYKGEYLLILERIHKTDDVILKCIDLINNYDILDDINIVKLCLKIFEVNIKYEHPSFKPLFCMLLIAQIKNRIKLSEYDCSKYLLELYNILQTADDSAIFKELKAQFLYFVVSFAHSSAIDNREMTDDIAHCLYRGYYSLKSSETIQMENGLTRSQIAWLNRQCILRQSFVNHMIFKKDDNNNNVSKNWIETICGLIWNKNDLNNIKDIERMFEKQKTDVSVTINRVISTDIQCFSQESTDFTLLIWQLLCHMEIFFQKDCENISVPKSAVLFIKSLLKSIFNKLPMEPVHDRLPENISKIDLITFLLGSVLTYRKLSTYQNILLPLPYECLKSKVKINHVTEKWFQAACDFILNNKRNTSIGMTREFLKKGLEIVQLIDNQLSDTVKLQLGRLLANFANECDFDKEVVFDRSIAFLYSAIKSEQTVATPLKSLQKSVYSSNLSLSRQSNFNSTFNTAQKVILFDIDNVSKEVLEKWKFEAYLCYIDWKLKLSDAGDEVNMYDIQDLIDSADALNSNHPSLDLLKSKMYLSFAMKCNDGNEWDKFNNFLSESNKFALRCDEHLQSVNRTERDELDLLLKEQFSAIEGLKISDDSLLHLYSSDDRCNSNELGLYQSVMSNYQTNNIRIENDVASIEYSNDKLSKNMASCLQKVEDVTYNMLSNKHDITLLKAQSVRENEILSNLFDKIDKMNKKFDKFIAIESSHEKIVRENAMIKLQLQSLAESVDELKIDNLQKSLNYNKLKQSIRLKSLLDQELSNFKLAIDCSLENVNNVVDNQREYFENVESIIIDEYFERKPIKTSKHLKCEAAKSTELNLSRFTANKWECPTCMVNNENDISSCPACTTAKPMTSNVIATKEKAVKKDDTAGFDLSRFTANKWECPTCMVNNDNAMSSCPACTTAKPVKSNVTVTKEIVVKKDNAVNNTGFDLSRYTANKWECPTCMVNNDNALSSCPACTTAKPNKEGTSTSNTTTKFGCTWVNKESNKEDKTPIKFGSTTNKENNLINKGFLDKLKESSTLKDNNNAPIKFGCASNMKEEPSTKFTFGQSSSEKPILLVETTSGGTRWECQCTTKNSNESNCCIACGEKRVEDSDSDSDVVIVSDLTEEQIERARALLLPDNFYYFENLPDKKDLDNDSEAEEVVKPTAAEEDGKNPEDFDPHYKPIVELPVVEIVTGEENWETVYGKRCKLFRFVNNGWVERGLGEMKIITKEDEGDCGKFRVRLLMRREQVHKVCCSQLVTKDCPAFSKMGTSVTSACWFGMDFSEGVEPIKEKLAIRFKTEAELEEFMDIVRSHQEKMV